ncbi:MAG: sulfite exporter TauE/SafE family protein [Lachnospiraceae bacterium]|nr:sulfite exporter TauE/SafE family protein [Lachnospiraceae bacterium]
MLNYTQTEGLADITYDSDRVTMEDIKTIIEQLDYEVLSDTASSGSDPGRIISLLAIIVLLYILLQQFGILNFLVAGQLADSGMGYGMLFIIGLITSVHCIAMCGGIHLSQCIPQEEDGKGSGNSRLAVFMPSFLYNLGRVAFYTAVGFLLGWVGMLMGNGSGAGLPAFFQGIIKMIAGILMIIMGINLLGIFPWLRHFHLRIPRFAAAAKMEGKRGISRRPLLVGLLNGLMPCGPLQSMQIVALASGSPFAGALSMFLFSLGTVPLMLGLGSLISVLGKKFSREVMNVGAVLIAVFGLAMLSQGGSLSGLLLPDRLLALVLMCCVVGVIAGIPFRRKWYRTLSIAAAIVVMIGGSVVRNRLRNTEGWKEADAAAEEAELADGVQVIHSTLSSGRYPNITVQAGMPVKWVIDAPSGTINGCNYKMLVKEYGIEHEFAEGENILEFTPTTPGTVPYTCWMGMIRGNIFVTGGEEAVSGEAGSAEALSDESEEQAADVPVPSGHQIPSDVLAAAQFTVDENGQEMQEVSVGRRKKTMVCSWIRSPLK